MMFNATLPLLNSMAPSAIHHCDHSLDFVHFTHKLQDPYIAHSTFQQPSSKFSGDLLIKASSPHVHCLPPLFSSFLIQFGFCGLSLFPLPCPFPFLVLFKQNFSPGKPNSPPPPFRTAEHSWRKSSSLLNGLNSS